MYLDEVEAGGAEDPFPGVDATVREHDRIWAEIPAPALVLVDTFAAANADQVDVVGKGFALNLCGPHHLITITL